MRIAGKLGALISSKVSVEHRQGRLVRQYFSISLFLVSGGLVLSGVIQIYFSYYDVQNANARFQEEIAKHAAFRIDQFFMNIEQWMMSSTKSQDIAREGVTPKYKFELERLLDAVPAITELAAFDAQGARQVQVRRFRASVSRGHRHLSPDAFKTVLQGKTYFGPVYYLQGSEPTMTVAVPIQRFHGAAVGALQGEIDLRYIGEVISGIKVGKAGYAYAVNHAGELIVHPDVSLVLQKKRVHHLPQVKAALQHFQEGTQFKTVTGHDLYGKKVSSSSAPVTRLEWHVLVELPYGEAHEALFASVGRTSVLLLIGFGIVLLASAMVARRVVRPLETLCHGVEEIGKGDLSHLLNIKTGNEIEILADEFNKMTAALRQFYAGLEAKVKERTQQLIVANERLEELNRVKSHFVSNVSHELKTPLAAIRSLLDNMLDGLTGPINEKQNRYMMGMKNITVRLARLVHDLLDLSVIEAGRMELKPTKFSLHGLVQEVTENFRPLAQEKHIAFEGVSCADNMPAWGDRDKIAQVLMNLIDNAVKFTPIAGRVTVTLAEDGGGWLQVSVADTGPGIAKDETSKIFEEFYQISHPDEQKSKGVGLGLAISKKFIELHGGTIRVESARGEGSTFSFTVPIWQAANTDGHTGPE